MGPYMNIVTDGHINFGVSRINWIYIHILCTNGRGERVQSTYAITAYLKALERRIKF